MAGLTEIQKRFVGELNKALAGREHGAQAELARAVGVSSQMMSNIVNGQRNCSEEMRRAIAREVGLDYDRIASGSTVQVAGDGNGIVQSTGDGSVSVTVGEGPHRMRGPQNPLAQEQPIAVSGDIAKLCKLAQEYAGPALIKRYIKELEDIKKLVG